MLDTELPGVNNPLNAVTPLGKTKQSLGKKECRLQQTTHTHTIPPIHTRTHPAATPRLTAKWHTVNTWF